MATTHVISAILQKVKYMSLHNNRAPYIRVPVYNWHQAQLIHDMFIKAGATWVSKLDSFQARCVLADSYNWGEDVDHVTCAFTAWSIADGSTAFVLTTHIPKEWLADKTCLNKRQLKRWLGLQVNAYGDVIPVNKYAVAPIKKQALCTAQHSVSTPTCKSKKNIFHKLLIKLGSCASVLKKVMHYLRNTSPLKPSL